MSPAKGHAQKDRAPESSPPPVTLAPSVLHVPAERVKELVAVTSNRDPYSDLGRKSRPNQFGINKT